MEYEDRLTISTPEGVELELTLAGIGSRFTASVIDHTIRFSLVLALTIALGIGLESLETSGGGVQAQDAGASASALGYAILTLAGFLVFVAYDVLFEVRAGGRTPGKRLTGLRVVRASGRPVGFLASAIRNVLRVVDFLPGFYGLAMTVIFASSRNQRLGDIAAGTVVVRERKGGRTRREPAAAAAAAPVAPAAGETAAWDVSAIAADELATVRRFLERRDALPDEPRAQLATDLAQRLRPKVAGAPEHLAPESFLEGLSAAKAARTV